MPYSSNKDLPDRVKNVLPYGAQTMWRKVFNSAYKTYGNDEQAAKAAWAQVKKYYKKSGDKWVSLRAINSIYKIEIPEEIGCLK